MAEQGPTLNSGKPSRVPAVGDGSGVGLQHVWGPRAEAVVSALVSSTLDEPLTSHLGTVKLPSRRAVGELAELAREVMFPGFFGKRGLTRHSLPGHMHQLVARIAHLAEEQVLSVLRYAQDAANTRVPAPSEGTAMSCEQRAAQCALRFVEQLPELRRLLALDVRAAFDGDPAAVHTDETIFCYPGVDAIFAHRVAHCFYAMGVPLLPRIIQEMAHSRTGIDIHPGAHIGESFFIDHGGGTVIGETTRIGRLVRVYQGVTLGAKSFDTDDTGRLVRSGKQRHPTIGDRVTIFAGAVILGGDTVIGDDCVIGGSVFITQSVPPGHVVRQKTPELVLRSAPSGASRQAQWKDPGAGI
ncbi:MAG: serine O-acetyltransferase [Phycisphaerales bacterium]